ncbi:PREDICTED: huntingtin-interacting protein K isoform X2 [Chinchilla lanigera]|uniref:huntingtin-interacting protein K isoform X2 n=2 Tax=Hystricomorpha TaxID=33550 RepID=UPI0006972E01|nr:PREDICTED: huntingtin-interacting protein K isoform X2 [Chinchilla lanigera]
MLCGKHYSPRGSSRSAPCSLKLLEPGHWGDRPDAGPAPARAEVRPRKLPSSAACEIDMATEGDVELELETETSCPERPPEKPRKHDSGAADLERVTDYAEEKEIQSSNLETGEGTGKGHYQEGRSGVDSE